MKRGWPWRRVLRETPEPWEQPEEEVVRFAARLRRGGRVLDLGCGPGRHTVYLAQQGFEVHASDIATDGLQETLRRIRLGGVQAAVLRSDMTAIPYPDAVFDAVIAVNVIYHGFRDDVEACLAEVRRVLKPMGLFFVTFNATESDDWGRGRRIDDLTFVKVGGVEDGIPHYFVDRAELERLMEAYELLDVSLKVEWPEDNDGRKAAHWYVEARRPES